MQMKGKHLMSQHGSQPPVSAPGREATGSMRSLLILGLGAMFAFVLLLNLAAAAQGAQIHAFSGSFGAPGSASGQLRLRPFYLAPSGEGENLAGSGVAVDDQTGDIYVADTGNNRVDEFDPSRPSGEQFVRAWGWGVQNGAAESEVCTTACLTGMPGTEPGQSEEPTFIAVDNSGGLSQGDVYVGVRRGQPAQNENQTVQLLDASGGNFTLTFEGQTTAPLAFDSTPEMVGQALEGLSAIGSHNVFVRSQEGGGWHIIFDGALAETNVPQLVADASDLTPAGAAANVETRYRGGPLASGLIAKFDSEGNLLETWATKGQLDGASTPEGPFGPLAGLAVDPTGHLWVAAAGRVYEFEQDDVFIRGWVAPRGGGVDAPQGLGVDSAEDLYIVGVSEGVQKLSSSGAWLGVVSPAGGFTGLAVDPPLDDLYLDQGGSISSISRQCAPVPVIGAERGCSPAQIFGAGHLDAAAGLAADAAGTVYAASTGTDQIAVFDVSLEATVSPATDLHATTATVNGRIDPKSGGNATRCFFRVGKTTSYGQNVPCLNASEVEVGTETDPISGPTEVHADLDGLEGGSTYHYTLRAFNLAEEVVTSEDGSFETSPIPAIGQGRTEEITATSAKLAAEIDPEGLAVSSCQIEWGTSTSYGTTIPCEPPSLAAGTASVPIAATLDDLTANTTYHWRVVAINANGTATGPDNTFVFSTESPGSPSGSCPNEALRQANGSLALPDCRAYELVDPPQKNGALLSPAIFGLTPSIAADGSRVIASSLQCFSDAQSCTGDRVSKGPPFEFERTSSGWVTRPLAPSASEFEINTVWGYSADSGQVLYSAPVPSHVTDEFYARRPGGAMEAIGPIAESRSFFTIGGSLLTATPDLSHVVYESSTEALWSFDKTHNSGSLYEYSGTTNSSPMLVGVSGEEEGSDDLISACGTKFGDGSEGQTLSADGRIVYFRALKCPTGSGANTGVKVPADQLYARVDGETSEAHTVHISASRCGTGNLPGEEACRAAPVSDAYMEAASQDGSQAVFTSTQQLTDEASEDGQSGDSAGSDGCPHTTGPNGCNLYLYDGTDDRSPADASLIDVSAGDTSGLGPQVQGVMALSPDGSHVYFVARGVLTGRNAEGNEPTEGADNLYLFQRDTPNPQGRTTFVATLPGGGAAHRTESLQWGEKAIIAANVSADGRFLLFSSHGALTPDARPGEGAQVYRYDAESRQLLRVSIGSQGFNNDGNGAAGEARIVPPEAINVGAARSDPSMSADGSRVFFQSPVALTAGALNEVPLNARGGSDSLAQNVYEWQAPGGPECDEADGCVALISDGHDVSEGSDAGARTTASAVELLGASTSGEDVFFSTVDPLVPADNDTGYDIYDARAGGGFAPAPTPTICQGDACKGHGTQAAAEGGAATSTFSGAEEGPRRSAMTKCKKGFVRKGSKCVKKPKQKKKHHKKSGSKKNGKHKHSGDDRGGKK
jgi:hypothetical protein